MNKGLYRILLVCVTVILLSVGLYIGLQISKNDTALNDDTKDITTTDVISKENTQQDKNTVDIYDDKNATIELVYEDYYSLDDKVVTNSNVVYGISVNDLKKQENEKNEKAKNGYELVEQSTVKLRYRRTLNQYSPCHFLVKLENGKVVIYNIVSDTVTTLYKTTDISESSLRPEVLEELNIGKRVDSKEALNELMEDIET